MGSRTNSHSQESWDSNATPERPICAPDRGTLLSLGEDNRTLCARHIGDEVNCTAESDPVCLRDVLPASSCWRSGSNNSAVDGAVLKNSLLRRVKPVRMLAKASHGSSCPCLIAADRAAYWGRSTSSTIALPPRSEVTTVCTGAYPLRVISIS